MISVPRGWVWGGTVPPGAKSARAMEMPRVLSPGICITLARVTFEPDVRGVRLGLAKPAKKKSEASKVGKQGKPFTITSAQENRQEVLKSQ